MIDLNNLQEDLNEITLQLRILLKRKRISQKKACQETGASTAQISRLLSNPKVPACMNRISTLAEQVGMRMVIRLEKL